MSFTQTVIGGAVGIAVLSVALDAALPPPAPITVHTIQLRDGAVLQERTVTADATHFWAEWTAAVIGPDDLPLPWCVGSGSWAYPVGRREFDIPLPEWVGSDACTVESLPKGVPLRLSAKWNWGGDYTSATSAPFTVE